MNKQYEDFCIGDVYTFCKTFTANDFINFSLLSGDNNPLHHDNEYAKKTPFKKTIVPLHLACSPLSAIAGMVFPGVNALYLGHDLKALKPVPYNVELTYSAKIIDKNDNNNLLIIQTIIFCQETIYVEAIQNIQVRKDNEKIECQAIGEIPSHFIAPNRSILLTGAAGEIGRNIAVQLAKKNYSLVLNIRNYDSRVKELENKLNQLNCKFELLDLDLLQANEEQIIDALQSLQLNVGAVIHSASPEINSPISEHIKVSFESLTYIFNALKHKWLGQQSGKIVLISSSATLYHPDGWQNYIAGKVATENYLKGLEKKYSQYGLNMKVLAPGKVNTNFSKNAGLDQIDSLQAEQVAAEVVSIYECSSSFYTWLETHSLRKGSIGFIGREEVSSVTAYESQVKEGDRHEESVMQGRDVKLKTFFKAFFNLSEPVDWGNVSINILSKWDSLRHIELLTKLEAHFHLKFTASEITQTTSFRKVLDLLSTKNEHEKQQNQ